MRYLLVIYVSILQLSSLLLTAGSIFFWPFFFKSNFELSLLKRLCSWTCANYITYFPVWYQTRCVTNIAVQRKARNNEGDMFWYKTIRKGSARKHFVVCYFHLTTSTPVSTMWSILKVSKAALTYWSLIVTLRNVYQTVALCPIHLKTKDLVLYPGNIVVARRPWAFMCLTLENAKILQLWSWINLFQMFSFCG